jgi:hypothetical protein
MTLSDLASIATVISSVAVLGSLIYLAQQTRQNVRHMRALLWQGASERTIALCLGMADSELAKPYLAANSVEPTPEAVSRHQVYLQHFAILMQFVEMLSQSEDGLLSEERFNFVRAQIVAQMAVSPGQLAFMEENLNLVAPNSKFRRLLQEVVGEAKARAASGLTPWRTE